MTAAPKVVSTESDRRSSVEASWPLVALLFLGMWLGATAFFSAVVAPAAFRVLPTRALAGALVGSALPVLFVWGIVAAAIAAAAAGKLLPPVRAIARWAAAGAAALLVVGQFVIGARIGRLRAVIGTDLDALAASDPMRTEFGRLHGYSVLTLGLAAILSFFVCLALARAVSRATRAPT